MARAARDPSVPGTFAYDAITPDGVTRLKGARMSAYNAAEVRRELIDQNFTPLKITEVNPNSKAISLNMTIGSSGLKLKPIQVAAFARGLNQLLRAGISVPRAIAALGEDSPNPQLTKVCLEISQKISNGSPIAEAFAEYPTAFDDVFCGYLAAGEKTGSLVASTRRLAELTEKRASLGSKIKAVSIYPILVGCVISFLVTGIILFLVPRYQQIYAQFHAKLPAPTEALVKVSNHFLPVKFGPFFIPIPDLNAPAFWALLLFIGYKVFRYVKRNDSNVDVAIDKIKYRLPISGKLTHHLILFRWVSTLSGALDSGVHTSEALSMAARASGSKWIKALTPAFEAGIQSGRPLSELLGEHPKLFPASVRTMVVTGEASGELSSMLDSTSAALSDEIDAIVAGLGAKIEVALIMVMGVVVGGILVVLYLPILNLATAVSNSANTPSPTTTTKLPPH